MPFVDEEPSQSDLITKQEQGNASTSAGTSNKGSAVNVSSEDPTHSKPQSASSNKEAVKKGNSKCCRGRSNVTNRFQREAKKVTK